MRAFPPRGLRGLRSPLLLALALGACQGSPGPGEQEAPVVLAAASLQESLTEIADAFAAGGKERPVLSFAATSSLARQVESGAPADLFIAADGEWMDVLGAKNLLAAGLRVDLLTNRLVLVVPVEADARGTEPLAGTERITMADPAAVPAGRYGRAALEQLGWWDSVAPRIVPAENVRAALAFVERGEVAAAIVYATDAQASKQVKVTYTFPSESHPPIVYPAALLAASDAGAAKEFLTFLRSDQAQAIFRQHGFGIAP
jgi:molybdate transport system substrate-binding protein